jgi:hypothetical protein
MKITEAVGDVLSCSHAHSLTDQSMNHKPDLAERIGDAINELDIDFSRLSAAGWLVSALSLAAGGGIAYALCRLMIQRNGMDLAAGMVFCFTMIAVTTASFLILRWMLHRFGLSVTKSA